MTGRVEMVGCLSGRRSRSDGETLEILAEAFRHAARAIIAAYSDEAGHLFRHEAGRRTDLKPASILI